MTPGRRVGYRGSSRERRALTAAILAAGVLLTVAPVSGTRAEQAALSAESPCRPHVERYLRAWGVVGPARTQPPSDAGLVQHWPTGAMGTWVVETRGARTSSLVRVSPDATLAVTWDSACTPVQRSAVRVRPAPPRFTDADLLDLLQRHPTGAIYVWSPHMPLSADGLLPLRRAADARGIVVTVLLDADSDRSFAARIAASRGWPPETGRVADSVELRFRDLHVHAPAVQMHVNGRLAGSPFPGAHSEDEYGSYFDRMIAEGRRDAAAATP